MKSPGSPKLPADAARRYASAFDARLPEVFAHFPGGADPVFPFEAGSDRGLGVLLLTAAVYRPGGEAAAARLLSGLYRSFGNDVFRLNRIPFESLQAITESLYSSADAEERARIPGILRSVCDFFYRVGPLGPWLATAPDWEMRVMELCGEIYWMGKQSLMRNKARYFLWLVAIQPGSAGEKGEGAFPQARDFAWPVGEGHLRFYIDFMRPEGERGGFKVREAQARLDFFRKQARELFPDAPWKLFAPLDAYLRRGGPLEYRCREAQGGCRPCPLSSACPAAPHFLLSER